MTTTKLTQLNRQEVLRYLGYREQALSLQLEEQIDRAISLALELAHPRSVYKRFKRNGAETPPAEELLLGCDIQEHLADSEEMILLAATVGSDLDHEIRRQQSLNMSFAVILDAAASTAIEAYLDLLEDQMRADFLQEGLYLTSRFSPGYGDLPLTIQGDLLRILDSHRKIGLAVGAGGLMNPIKSVSCIMGLSRQGFGKAKDPCEICSNRDNCGLRRRGGYCGKFRSNEIS